jgi:hypothetical protein
MPVTRKASRTQYPSAKPIMRRIVGALMRNRISESAEPDLSVRTATSCSKLKTSLGIQLDKGPHPVGYVRETVRPSSCGKQMLTIKVRNLLQAQSSMGEQMFEVSEYEHPYIFVTRRQNGETYRFLVRDDGTLAHDGARFDQGQARLAAIAYLAQRARTIVGELASA